ncbi:hypothetical protein [Alicyclobacillus acidiphilus]|uniref:hypothetical protein n=1 Tax=Alicyclobacillus acidiphilus TaxID=182455 RepID=UPI0008330C9D|nr:hypothetical protein [Alicyclobacillus acidiphilus]
MKSKSCANRAEWYHWYEITEEPLWFQSTSGYEDLSWWLRRVSAEEVQWFVQAYPALAPYYPVTSLGEANWLDSYYTYWWP